jgi:hypothetical protein
MDAATGENISSGPTRPHSDAQQTPTPPVTTVIRSSNLAIDAAPSDLKRRDVRNGLRVSLRPIVPIQSCDLRVDLR